jgi:ornithine cyclodeaminase/alanine dehydrogenase-like protein (mu-crystallin family)
VVSIANSDTVETRSEVDEETFARADDIVINDWDSVVSNRQVELLSPIENGSVDRTRVHTLPDLIAGKVVLRQEVSNILYYKNNTGLAIQFAACGAILYRKLLAEGTNRTIPRDWFASQKYSMAPAHDNATTDAK